MRNKKALALFGLFLSFFFIGAGCQVSSKVTQKTVDSTYTIKKNTVPAPLQSSSTTEICASLYSGRPDPCWTLSESETSKILDMVQAAATTSWSLRQEQLGYRGFYISLFQQNKLAPAPTHISIFHGRIAYNKDGGMAYADSRVYIDEPNPHFIYKEDAERDIESWLISLAEQHVSKEELQSIRQSWPKK